MVEQQSKRIKSKKKSASKTPKNFIEKPVEFTFLAPEAREVFLAGEFNGWDTQSLPMKKSKGGIWKAKVKLSPGRHEYKFFADNVWVESLPGVEQVYNPLGTRNFIAWVN